MDTFKKYILLLYQQFKPNLSLKPDANISFGFICNKMNYHRCSKLKT